MLQHLINLQTQESVTERGFPGLYRTISCVSQLEAKASSKIEPLKIVPDQKYMDRGGHIPYFSIPSIKTSQNITYAHMSGINESF